MYDFEDNVLHEDEIKAKLKKPKKYGVGINDAWYVISATVDGKTILCPIYIKWTGMLDHCYSKAVHKRKPSYIGDTVCEEWLTFSNFRDDMLTQDWEGMVLTKNIINPNNKVYSPETCLFVPQALSQLIVSITKPRGDHLMGVTFDKKNKKFRAGISLDGKQKHLGCYQTEQLAHEAFKIAHNKRMHELIDEDIYPMATPYLEQYIL